MYARLCASVPISDFFTYRYRHTHVAGASDCTDRKQRRGINTSKCPVQRTNQSDKRTNQQRNENGRGERGSSMTVCGVQGVGCGGVGRTPIPQMPLHAHAHTRDWGHGRRGPSGGAARRQQQQHRERRGRGVVQKKKNKRTQPSLHLCDRASDGYHRRNT